MSESIKVIWDFYGPLAQRTAEHHRVHVDEFASREQLGNRLTGAEAFAEDHWITWLVVEPADVAAVRAALRPNRAVPVSA